jgi:uncharacterized protein YdhG (YjbR/CyaY superfamily)
MTSFQNIDEYISSFPADVQVLLEQMRTTISSAAPQSEETISYGIPTFKLKKNLVHFAAHKKHIGFYPGPSGLIAFASELIEYKTTKGAVQFPLDRELPLPLVYKITAFRVQENLKK